MLDKDLPGIEVAFDEVWQALCLFSGQLQHQAHGRGSSDLVVVVPTLGNGEISIPQQPQRAVIRGASQRPPSRAISFVYNVFGAVPEYSPYSSTSSLSLRSAPSTETLKAPEKTYIPKHLPGISTRFTPFTKSNDSLDKNSVKSDNCSLESVESFRYSIAEAEDLDALTAAHPRPALTGSKWSREFRYSWASAYRRLWIATTVANVLAIAAMIHRVEHHQNAFTYGHAATATAANLVVAALMRQEHVINLLFHLACALPYRTPLLIRRQAAKLYCYGGVHSGCGISAFLWYIFYTVLSIHQFEGTNAERTALAATTTATLWILAIIVVMAHPYIRRRWHNQWELSHRIGGWTAVILVWAQTVIVAVARGNKHSKHLGTALIKTPTFWFLLVITACLIYPWLRLRRRSITPQKLSDHAVRLHFNDKTLPTCVGYRLSDKPLLENHGFATIPNPNGQPGYSIVVSNAGDWTKKLINNPPSHIWTRGAPTTGVMRIASLFRPIVVIATGSGIGPCLSFLQVHPKHPMRIIWSARSPEKTYGSEIMRVVLRADKRAIIIDTKKTGHPDLTALAWAMYEGIRAEAVVIISNPAVTRKVVFEMECRGVAAFGAIFDS